jgi:glucoamylase
LVSDTIKLVDALLRKELPQGPCWYRYTGDGYGEHQDGTAYDGTGRGRLWPLLTGERGHYELVRGNNALSYLQAMAAMAGQAGMLPEQVWDKNSIPQRGLYAGRPTGAAMPLAWAHAEYIKLAYSILAGHPVDRPEPLWARYHGHLPQAHIWYWSPQMPVDFIYTGLRLGFCLHSPASIRWRTNVTEYQSLDTSELSPGIHVARLPVLDEIFEYVLFRISGTGWEDGPEHKVAVIA